MKPILTAHLLPLIEARLLELLRSLTAGRMGSADCRPCMDGEGGRRASARHAASQAVACARRLHSERLRRDSHHTTSFSAFINGLNREGVEMYRRLSPAVLISMMEIASRESAEFHQSLDPMAEAAFSVSWAGEESVAQLVRYRSGAHRAMAPPATNPDGDEPAGHHDA